MPVHAEHRNRMWRLIEPSGRIAKNRAGTAIDGGGHGSRRKAAAQARAVNAGARR